MSEQPDRSTYIGSSDAAAICGVDPWRSASDVYCAKVFPTAPLEQSLAMRIGTFNEPLLVELALEKISPRPTKQIYRDWRVFWDRFPHLSAQIDAAIPPDEIIEAKMTGLGGWGDPEVPNDVPAPVLVQTHFAMGLYGARICYVPVIRARFSGLRFDLYRVERVDELAQEIIETCHAFWVDHVETRIPPSGSPVRMSTIKRIVREPEKVIQGTKDAAEAASSFEAVSHAYRALGKIRDDAQAELLRHFEDGEGLQLPDGTIYTYLPVSVPPKMVRGYSYRRLHRCKDRPALTGAQT